MHKGLIQKCCVFNVYLLSLVVLFVLSHTEKFGDSDTKQKYS